MTHKVFVIELTEEFASKIAAKRRPPAAKRGAAFSEAWKMGKAVAGYDETSPIWGLKRAEVRELMEDCYDRIVKAKAAGDVKAQATAEGELALLEGELEKRKAARAIAWKAKGGKRS